MLVKCSTAFFCVAVATSSAGASVGQVRYPAHGKDSALGALSTRRRDDSTARWHQQELTSARGAATTLRHVLHSSNRSYRGWLKSILFLLSATERLACTPGVQHSNNNNNISAFVAKIWGVSACFLGVQSIHFCARFIFEPWFD